MERPLLRDRPVPTPEERGQRDRRAWLIVAVLVPVLALVIVGLVVVLGVAYNLTAAEEPISVEERALVLDAAHLSSWMTDHTPDETRALVRKVRYFDDSYELEYEYDLPEVEEAPYLTYTLTFETGPSDATTTYASYWGGTRIAFYFLGDVQIDIDERNDLFSWGDQSRFGLLLADGEPFGNVFVARRGDTVVYMLLSGLYFVDTSAIRELLMPYLGKLDAYESG